MFIAEISNNKLSYIIQNQNKKNIMFYHQENTLVPCYFFYVYLPVGTQSLQNPKAREQLGEKYGVMENCNASITDEEKIILTKEDLQKEGYVQTKKPWTKSEDRLLLSLCKDQNARFEDIATHMEGRNAKMCYSRYRRLAYFTKTGWSKLENQRLIELVQQYGEGDWKTLASLFEDKNHKQLKEHYTNYLKPELIKSEWTLDEDLQLVKLINVFGKDWKRIETEFNGRSRSQIKNRFFGKIFRMNKRKIETQKNQASITKQASLI